MNAPAAGASWGSFSAAPHRLFFFGGALYGVVAAGLWTVRQASVYIPWLQPLAWTLPPPLSHGVMMVYGVLGFYLFAFLLTAFPRWVEAPPVSRRVYLAIWFCHTAGAHGFWLGLFFSRALALAACGALVVSHALATAVLAGSWARSGRWAGGHPAIVVTGLTLGVAGLTAGTAGLALEEWRLVAALRWIGIYPYLTLTVLAVAHRMVPFFTSAVTPGLPVRRSPWALPLLAPALILRALAGWWPVAALAWSLDALVVAVLLAELWRWRFWRANFPPLLVVLYLAVGWIVLAFALAAGEGLVQLFSGTGAPPFRHAALHALTVGGFGTLMLGMSTRVSLGHSGRGLATDARLNALFYGFQLVVLARIVPDIAGFWRPAWGVHGFWSGAGWALAFALWLALLGPTLLRPRGDGRPG